MPTSNFARILDVIDTLTGPQGCPWDKEQTPRSLCDYLIEECFELVEAIRQNDQAEIAEELGDVLFLLLCIGRYLDREHPGFLENALAGNVAKMIRRHPHVYSAQETDTAQVLHNWEQIKKQEKNQAQKDPGVFSSLPDSLPPLLKAYRINSKAARQGFTWPSDDDQERKVQEEWQELQTALQSGTPADQEEEFGDYLFTLVEYGRRRGIKANAALATANSKFLTRFKKMEHLARERGLELDSMTLAEMDILWDEVKKE